jgi:hypothetical protein
MGTEGTQNSIGIGNQTMTFELKRFGTTVTLLAKQDGLHVVSSTPIDWTRPESWPAEALQQGPGRRTAYDVASLVEMGLAEILPDSVVLPYKNFPDIESEEFRVTTAFTLSSPFLLKIDRVGDIGRPDFRYKYQYVLGPDPVSVERVGFYLRRSSTEEVFLLDERMYSLLEAMDTFNSLPSGEKGVQRSWLDFANIKRWAVQIHATLDATLLKNDVIIPSSIGLDLYEDEAGSLSFIPTCPELENRSFRSLFERNSNAEGFYSLDHPGMGKLRIVLTEKQKKVLDRMKRVQRVTGEVKEKLIENPAQIFDGVTGDVELPYGDRVIGIGTVEYDSVPKPQSGEGSMSELFGTAESSPEEQRREIGLEKDGVAKKSLIIKDHTEDVGQDYMAGSELARISASVEPYARPASLSQKYELKPHQRDGVQWLQTCVKIMDRTGVLLADDMGVGKTLQILSFLAWAIESGRFPDLSRSKPPFRPILIVAPLILVETEVWQKEMHEFFSDKGEVFGNVLPLYGPELKGYIRKDAEGREDIVAKPILNLERIQRNQVVITNYEVVRDYEFSFAYCPGGRSLWSVVITDEAQEYKTPNSKVSHAMKALKPDFRIACTGTPVENRLLDMWNLFDTIQPGLLGSAKEFSQQYEGRNKDSYSDLKSRLLYQKPHAFLLRRKKSEVLELPKKSECKLECIMSESEVLKHLNLIEDLSATKRSKGKLDLLQKFARLYQHPLLLDGDGDDRSVQELRMGSSKLRETLAALNDIRKAGEKAIVFARHKDMQRILARVLSEEFGKPVRIVNGDTPRSGRLNKSGAETRGRILEQFRKSSGFDVVILSPFVAGVGLTIVEANHVIHYGRWWNPAVESQATDRTYRLGQTKEVTVYLPILKDAKGRISRSFDQLLDELMERKKVLAEGALQMDDFLAPQENEDEAGLQVCAELESSVNPDAA